MKKKSIIIFSLLMFLLISNASFASGNSIGITINNEVKVIPKEMGQPFSSDSRTFVPLRFVSETLGFKVDWDNPTRTATVHSRDGEIKVTIGKESIITPSGVVEMDVKPFIKDTRTYVPVRFVAETLGFKVDWIPASEVENSSKHSYINYVTINGELGSAIETTEEATDIIGTTETSSSGVSNVVSDNPADWPETENKDQKHFDLAKNKELIEYLNQNYSGRYYIAGYSIPADFGERWEPAFVISKDVGGQMDDGPALFGNDLREVQGSEYWYIHIDEISEVREGFEQILLSIAGETDGKYILDYFEKHKVENLTIFGIPRSEDLIVNEWIKTPSGREFQISFWFGRGGIQLLVR